MTKLKDFTMGNPKTFGSDYERGYQAALDDVHQRLDAWVDQGLRTGDLVDELAMLRKPKTRRETRVLELKL